MTASPESPHWTEVVYCENAKLLFDVEAAIFQNQELTQQELAVVDRLAAMLGTEVRSPVIDIACGPGRHSIQMCKNGLDVTGLDFSEGLLEIAADFAGKAFRNGSGPSFRSGDMRDIDFPDASFNSVLILGNSFGYFSDEDNLRALREAVRILKPGGFLCIEITNKEEYLRTFEAVAEETVEGHFLPRLKCEWRKQWEPANNRVTTVEKHSNAETGEVLYEGPYDVRLFDQEDLIEMMSSLGLKQVTCLPFTPGRESLSDGLGETFGAMEEMLFVGGIK